ncbi:MAG TPA: ACT domain-containing protein, partial [Pirellulales bacterium]|nr:ACT domain-containing protein [Pirellulales bacterium]
MSHHFILALGTAAGCGGLETSGTMQIVITAVGPDNRGLADPIIHHVTGQGANITEIQMFDHDEQSLFAMLLRIELSGEHFAGLATELAEIGRGKGLSVRIWSPERRAARPRLALCTTFRPEPALAVLRGVRDRHIAADAVVMLGNRPHCRSLAEQFGVDWHLIGDDDGVADDERMIALCDEYQVDYLVLARYMRVLPPSSCWKYAGGR